MMGRAAQHAVIEAPLPVSAPTWSDLSVLMTRAQDGDKAGYALLLLECRKIIWSVAIAAGLTGMVREQMVADTLRAVHDARNTYDRLRPFANWLLAIAHHHASLHLRRQRDAGSKWHHNAVGRVKSWIAWGRVYATSCYEKTLVGRRGRRAR